MTSVELLEKIQELPLSKSGYKVKLSIDGMVDNGFVKEEVTAYTTDEDGKYIEVTDAEEDVEFVTFNTADTFDAEECLLVIGLFIYLHHIRKAGIELEMKVRPSGLESITDIAKIDIDDESEILYIVCK